MPHEALALQISQNHGLQLFAPPLRALIAGPSAKLAMPLQPHKATIVMPAFARSLSADEKQKLSELGFCGLRIVGIFIYTGSMLTKSNAPLLTAKSGISSFGSTGPT